MKRAVVYFSIVLLWVSFSSVVQAHTVRVRLMTTSEKIKLSGVGVQFQNLNKPFRQVAIPSHSQIEIRTLKKQGKKLWALRGGNGDLEHIFKDKYLLIQGDSLRIGSNNLPSRVLLSQSSGNTIDLVGVMPLDDYLVGVLASEMPLNWPLETLKAQAVAARSYALATMEERRNESFHLESSVMDQVFRHVLGSDKNNPLVLKAMQAVQETRDQVLHDREGKVLKAFFHSDCGGRTTAAKNVWGGGVNAGVAEDRSCPTGPSGHWKLSLSQKELSQRLSMASVVGVSLIKIPSEERIQKVRIVSLNGTTQDLSVNQFRQSVGFQRLKSSVFEVRQVGTEFVFQGKGLGHGVGLCQWGSRALGKKGLSYKNILRHYYPLAKLQ